MAILSEKEKLMLQIQNCSFAEELYEKCEDIDIIYEDIVGFLINRVVDTSEVSQLIGCSRQYINQLVNQEKIKPIKEGANNNLFMRSDIEEELA